MTELRLEAARLAVAVIGFFLLSAADRLAVAGGGSVFVCTDEFAAVFVEADVSGVALAAFSAVFVGAVPGD
ncbi:MAG TPA: hypothetical protein VGQ43_01390 [Candidatus Udaeobacter sp.]|nr:hypothetical protein [Candidatus Udaeobacter sp.]